MERRYLANDRQPAGIRDMQTHLIDDPCAQSLSERSSWKRECKPEETDYGNQLLLSQEFSHFAESPELCDIMFLVGMDKVPMYGVRAILAARSKVFLQLIYADILREREEDEQFKSNHNGAILSKLQPIRRSVKKRFQRHSSRERRSRVGIRKISDQVIQVDDFEPDVFKQLLEFLHTGSVMLQPRTMLGLLNAADHFCIEDLKRACMTFCDKCIRVDTVCALLLTAERYIQYKSTKIFLQKVLDFISNKADKVLSLNDIVHLPRHILELIMAREDLQASALCRYYATERWVSYHKSYKPDIKSSVLMQPFLPYIAFHEIPTEVLMRHIRPQGIIPDTLLMNALILASEDCATLDIKPGYKTKAFTPQIPSRKCIETGGSMSLPRGQHRKQTSAKTESSTSDLPRSSIDSTGSERDKSILSEDTTTILQVDETNHEPWYKNNEVEERFGTVILIDDDQEVLLACDTIKKRQTYEHIQNCYSNPKN